MSNTSCPPAICADGFSAGLKLAAPATSAPRWINDLMNAFALARIASISAFDIG